MAARGFRAAIERLEGIADRLSNTAPALERAAEACAEATRSNITSQNLVRTGHMLESVYSAGKSFGARARYTYYVDAVKKFLPVRGGKLVDPLSGEVRKILDEHVTEDR